MLGSTLKTMDEKILKYKKTPQILKSRKPQLAPQKFQHRLIRPPQNIGPNFRTKAVHHLVAKNLFKLPHDYHIYNKKGEKEITYNILLLGDSGTCWKAVGNELVRLANGIDNLVKATNTI